MPDPTVPGPAGPDPDTAPPPGLAGRSAWVVTEGHAGMEVQALALARALGLDPVVRRVPAPRGWGWLPANLWPAPLAFARDTDGKALAPPWPDVLVTCGRRSAALALAIAHRSRVAGGPGTFTIHLQDPRVDVSALDVVVVPAHDRLRGANVVTCLGSLHAITPDRLAAAAGHFRPRFAHLPRPLVAALIGGPSRAYRMMQADMAALGAGLAGVLRETGAGLIVTPSRRTGRDNLAALATALSGTGAEIWDGSGENPYLGLLGLADALVVTCDSVNMTTEAAATGRPVYVSMAPGRSARLDAFHAAMQARGHTRAFEGRIEFGWRPARLFEMPGVAADIVARFKARSGPAD